ncbi:MAG: glycosyltransferase family 4 protein [Thermodesulfovibrionia bacterium]|nr:glycosyltransferase family 4 protein [Thermodesulfovibrionia bacterium]
MKVSIIEPVGGHAGLEIYDLGVCVALDDANCDVFLYTCNKIKAFGFEKKFTIKRYFGKMYDLKRNKILRAISFFKGLCISLLDIFRNKSDIVYLHVFTFSAIECAILLTALIFSKKIVINIHDPIKFGIPSNRHVKNVFSKCLFFKKVMVTTHTAYSKNVIREVFPHLPVSIMPHSDIDLLYDSPMSVAECKTKVGLKHNLRYVLFFGQIKSTKGVDTLLKSWADVSRTLSNVRLLIVGRCYQDDPSNYKRIIEREGISSSVIWREMYVDDTEVPCYFKSVELVVLPYNRIYSSGVLLRAFGYGTPVIVSDQSAFIEIVGDSNSAIVFETGDYGDLAQKLKLALGDQELLKRLSVNAKALIQRRHSWEYVGKKMCTMFREAIRE